jgi:acetyltransferase
VAAIQFLLYKFAYLVTDFPEIREMDLNPFVVDEHGGVVLDAKIVLDEEMAGKAARPFSHMVIRPYPTEYEKPVQLKNGSPVLLRPIRPEDEPMEAELLNSLSAEAKRFRFFAPVKEATHEMLIPYTQIDYDREIAIIAEVAGDSGKQMAGVVRLIADAYNETAEYAIVVGASWEGQGLGTTMTRYILEIARLRGIKKILAYVLEDNAAMLHLFRKFGFSARKEEDCFRVELPLDPVPAL